MEKKYKVEQSENGHQFFVMSPYEGKYKIEKVFYSQERADEYIKVATIVDNAIKKD